MEWLLFRNEHSCEKAKNALIRKPTRKSYHFSKKMEGVEFTIFFYQKMEGLEFTIILLIKKVRVVEFTMNL